MCYFTVIKKSRSTLQWAVAFWIGVGLMSIINIWKITSSQHPVNYSWIMFWISLVFILICIVLMNVWKKPS